MKFKSIINSGILFVAIALLASCTTSTKLLSSWKDDNYAGGHIKSIMIIGVSKNKSSRTTFERAFVEQFKGEGVEAVASVDILLKDEESSKDAIKGAAEKLGIDTIMVTHLVGVDKDKEFVPASTSYNNFGSYYSRVYYPSYSYDITTVQLESKIYETKSEKLIWSAQSRTISEAYKQEVKYEIIKDVCKSVVKELHKNGLLK